MTPYATSGENKNRKKVTLIHSSASVWSVVFLFLLNLCSLYFHRDNSLDYLLYKVSTYTKHMRLSVNVYLYIYIIYIISPLSFHPPLIICYTILPFSYVYLSLSTFLPLLHALSLSPLSLSLSLSFIHSLSSSSTRTYTYTPFSHSLTLSLSLSFSLSLSLAPLPRTGILVNDETGNTSGDFMRDTLLLPRIDREHRATVGHESIRRDLGEFVDVIVTVLCSSFLLYGFSYDERCGGTGGFAIPDTCNTQHRC